MFKFKRPNFWPNFGLILADSGRALVVDCGLLDEKFLDTALEGMREHFGLKAIDAVIITHTHGDHFLEAPHLREKWGAPVWALDNMVDKMEHPEWFDYAAPLQACGKKNLDGSPMTGVRVDRAFTPGKSFTWEGYRFTVDWMPGQTELRAEPARLVGGLAGESRVAVPVRLKAAPGAAPGIRIVAFDVTLDAQRYGERFDVVVDVAAAR